jgi:hypothetical protein
MSPAGVPLMYVAADRQTAVRHEYREGGGEDLRDQAAQYESVEQQAPCWQLLAKSYK